MQGRHPFAIYRWVFELDADAPGRTRVRSATWAAFPGIHGKIYRALVIGTGGHRVAVQWTLKRIAAAALDEWQDSGKAASDYTDVFEVPIRYGDVRPADQMFRDALQGQPGGGIVLWIHRHILRFRPAPQSCPEQLIGWPIVRSDHDEIVLATSGPLMRGELTLRREDDRRATLTTRVHYRRGGARAVWAVVGPLHRAIAARLVERAAASGRREAAARR